MTARGDVLRSLTGACGLLLAAIVEAVDPRNMAVMRTGLRPARCMICPTAPMCAAILVRPAESAPALRRLRARGITVRLAA